MGARDEVLSFVENHERWRSECINLIASENVSSLSCSRAVGSEMMHKYAEGWPKQRYYQGCRWVDEAELLANSQFYKLFKADFVDLRPVSGACANIALFFGMTQPGDTIMSLHTSHGGHISHAEFGAAGLRGLRVVTFPYNDKEMNIDSDKMVKLIEEEKPKLILFGCSLFLFPHPLSEAREAAEEVEATICYDAAHVLGLMAGGEFQNPFEEGAKIITSSTHKTFPGPQGGCIMIKYLPSDKAANLQWATFPATVSNHHLHHVAAKGITGAEMVAFGKEYASQVIRNAKALGKALSEEGFHVVAEHKGFTESHQIALDFRDFIGKWAAQTLERANIITNKNLLPWDPVEMSDNPTGMRLGTQEMTRLGMRESEMKYIAELFKKVVLEKRKPEEIAEEVKEFRGEFQKVLYCFD